MKLVNRCLELWIFLNIVLEYLFVLSFYSYREVSGLCVPVSLRFRRNKEFYKFPCCTKLFRILVIKSPQRSASNRYTTLIRRGYFREISSTNFEFTVNILQNLF